MLSGFETRSCRCVQKILPRSDQQSHAERRIDGVGSIPHKSNSSVLKKVVIRHAVVGMWMMRSVKNELESTSIGSVGIVDLVALPQVSRATALKLERPQTRSSTWLKGLVESFRHYWRCQEPC